MLRRYIADPSYVLPVNEREIDEKHNVFLVSMFRYYIVDPSHVFSANEI